MCSFQGQALVVGGGQRVDGRRRGVFVAELELDEGDIEVVAGDQLGRIRAAEGMQVESGRETEFVDEGPQPADQVRGTDQGAATGGEAVGDRVPLPR